MKPKHRTDIGLIAYIELKSWLHEVNPIVKSLGMVVLITVAVISYKLLSSIALMVFALGIIASASIPLSPILRIYRVILFLSIGLLLANFLFVRPEVGNATVVFRVGPISGTLEGLLRGVRIVLRMLAILTVTSMFVLSTEPTEFLRQSVRILRIPPRIAYPMLIALRILPIFKMEYERIAYAQKVRCVKHKSLFHKMFSVSIPLLSSAMLRAERIALAMAAKGLDMAQPPEEREIRLSKEDQIFLSLSMGMAVLILIYTFWTPYP